MTTFWIDHKVSRFSAVMNACAKLGVSWDKNRDLHYTTDSDVAAKLKSLGAKISEDRQ